MEDGNSNYLKIYDMYIDYINVPPYTDVKSCILVKK